MQITGLPQPILDSIFLYFEGSLGILLRVCKLFQKIICDSQNTVNKKYLAEKALKTIIQPFLIEEKLTSLNAKKDRTILLNILMENRKGEELVYFLQYQIQYVSPQICSKVMKMQSDIKRSLEKLHYERTNFGKDNLAESLNCIKIQRLPKPQKKKITT